MCLKWTLQSLSYVYNIVISAILLLHALLKYFMVTIFLWSTYHRYSDKLYYSSGTVWFLIRILQLKEKIHKDWNSWWVVWNKVNHLYEELWITVLIIACNLSDVKGRLYYHRNKTVFPIPSGQNSLWIILFELFDLFQKETYSLVACTMRISY